MESLGARAPGSGRGGGWRPASRDGGGRRAEQARPGFRGLGRVRKAGSPGPSPAVGRRSAPTPDPGPPERVQRAAGGLAGVAAASEQEEEPPPRQGQPRESRRTPQVRGAAPPPAGAGVRVALPPGREGRGRGWRGRGLAEETEAGGKCPRGAAGCPQCGLGRPDPRSESSGSPYF